MQFPQWWLLCNCCVTVPCNIQGIDLLQLILKTLHQHKDPSWYPLWPHLFSVSVILSLQECMGILLWREIWMQMPHLLIALLTSDYTITKNNHMIRVVSCIVRWMKHILPPLGFKYREGVLYSSGVVSEDFLGVEDSWNKRRVSILVWGTQPHRRGSYMAAG